MQEFDTDRFSIDNMFLSISLDQFRRTAYKLKYSLRIFRPAIQSELLLTTNREDYYGHGSLTILTPEVEKALDRREKFQLSDLDEGLWRRSFKRGLYITDNSVSEPYFICLSNEAREPRRLFFYGQCLDEGSKKVLEGFKEVGIFQRLGDGHHKISDFALDHALRDLSSR